MKNFISKKKHFLVNFAFDFCEKSLAYFRVQIQYILQQGKATIHMERIKKNTTLDLYS